ncbi:uncharacterized protein MONOS_16388 [Monocercomonoides exilis]|uniref:uncharacterized protein n=1 Tax=Monocercomonoides exilis TaxID=2049356 RepID=UPI003559C897|nr:hypothetical protein MONOS_16388 [Monocercomonoides exilis]|eukprot:MONOS_16388.1-p1 / transcript=MONOS_16388.1 / gene=MONOS_16388 / organism=Monocercomonoides_exilis_PA203 / gene_product=unspecified product / transcript_product=unspecified product / location=Mono_scaffold01698:1873-2946(+) / protein_length=245 / sequence_SO=supercontig / SO=protein_coding / is_pseudo=false
MELLEQFSSLEELHFKLQGELEKSKQEAEKAINLEKLLDEMKEENRKLNNVIELQQESMMKAASLQAVNQQLLRILQQKDEAISSLTSQIKIQKTEQENFRDRSAQREQVIEAELLKVKVDCDEKDVMIEALQKETISLHSLVSSEKGEMMIMMQHTGMKFEDQLGKAQRIIESTSEERDKALIDLSRTTKDFEEKLLQMSLSSQSSSFNPQSNRLIEIYKAKMIQQKSAYESTIASLRAQLNK